MVAFMITIRIRDFSSTEDIFIYFHPLLSTFLLSLVFNAQTYIVDGIVMNVTLLLSTLYGANNKVKQGICNLATKR